MKNILSKRKKILFFLIFFCLFISLSFSFAQQKCPQIEWPRSPTGTSFGARWVDGKCKYDNFTILIKYLYEWGIAIGGIVLLFVLILAGFQYLTSFGNPQAMQEAKDRLKSGFLGLILLLGSWLILNAINPQLTKFRALSFNPQQLSEAMADCDTDRDCQKFGSNAKCINDSNESDGKKEGICHFFLPETPICDRVVLYSEPKFKGQELGTITAGKGCHSFDRPWWAIFGKGGIFVKSTRGFYGNLKDKQCYLFDQKTDKEIEEIDSCEETPVEINGRAVYCQCQKCAGSLHLFTSSSCDLDKLLIQLDVTNEHLPINVSSQRIYGASLFDAW